MWTYLVRVILRNRLANLIIIALLSIFMGYHAKDVELSYELVKMLPSSNPTSIEYEEFKSVFGQDGSVFFIGIQDDKLFRLEEFNDWYDLTYKIREEAGIQEVLSIERIFQLSKNYSVK